MDCIERLTVDSQEFRGSVSNIKRNSSERIPSVYSCYALLTPWSPGLDTAHDARSINANHNSQLFSLIPVYCRT